MSESAIFRAAVELPPEQRPAYLDKACRNNDALRREMEQLLAAHETANSFLKHAPEVAYSTAGFEPIVERAGAVIGPYKLMEQIGEGGFGLVFVAEQQHPVRRKVALKIVKPGMDTREVVARFEMERQALALMDHPNIARVFDGGETNSGRPFFVMELVKGVPIIEYSDQHQLTARERLQLFISVCQAAQHAHAKGIIHRDLKPSNILVAPHDGVPVVKVIDFGIAKAIGQQLTEKTIYTRFAQMIGTPLYMSPEQAEINALDVDIRSDVYSLGVLLYELLTGTTPFDPQRLQRAAYEEIRRIIREEEPPKPSTRLSTMGESLSKVSSQRRTAPAELSALVRGDLDWIVMKCLEKDRTRRYETAVGLAKDVQRYLADEPIEARPPSLTYRGQKFIRRHRGPVVIALVIVALLCLGLVGTLAGMLQAQRAADRAARAETKALADRDDKEKARQAEAKERATAQRERDEAQRAREELRVALYRSDMSLLQAAWDAHNTSRVLEILAAHAPQAGEKDLRGFEWRYWDRLCHNERRSMQLDIGSAPSQPRGDFVAFSALGNVCAAVTIPERAEPNTALVKVWNTADGREVTAFPIEASGSIRVALSGDGRRIAAAIGPVGVGEAAQGKIVIWDIPSRRESVTVQTPPVESPARMKSNRVIQPMLSRDGRRLAAFLPAVLNGEGMRLPSMLVWDVDENESNLVFTHPGMFPGCALSPDGLRIATLALGAAKGSPLHWEMRLRDAATGEVVAVTPWPTPAGPPAAIDPNHHDTTLLVFSPDGSRLAGFQRHRDATSGTPSGQAVIWDNNGKQQTTFQPDFRVAYLSFRPDGKQLLTTFGDRNPVATVWDATTGKEVQTYKGNVAPVVAASFVEEGKALAAIDLAGKVKVWDAAPPSRKEVRQSNSVSQWSLDGSRLAVFSPTATDGISIRDAAGNELARLVGHASPIASVQFSFNGRYLVSMDQAEAVKVWDTSSGQAKIEQQWPSGRRFNTWPTPIFSADGERLAMRIPDGGVKVWQLTPEARELIASDVPARQATLSANGRKLVALCEEPLQKSRQEAELIAWDVDTGARTILTKGRFQNLSLSSDGKYLAAQRSAQGGRTGFFNRNAPVEVLIWNTESEMDVIVLKEGIAHGAMAFSPDSKWLATTAVSTAQAVGDILLWDLATRQMRRLTGHADHPIGIAFSPDGRRLASIAQPLNAPRGELKLWDTAAGSEVLGLHTSGLLSTQHLFSFSPDGQRIFVMSDVGPEIWSEIWDATPRRAEQR